MIMQFPETERWHKMFVWGRVYRLLESMMIVPRWEYKLKLEGLTQDNDRSNEPTQGNDALGLSCIDMDFFT